MRNQNSAEKIDSPDKAQTREKILDAAASAFSQRGYHETAVDDIVKASGTSKGAFYFYFQTKEDIFFALVNKLLERLTSSIEKDASNEKDGLSKMMAGIDSFFDICYRHQTLAKIVLVGTVGLGRAHDNRLMELHSKFAGVMKGYIDQAVKEGSLPPMDTELAAYVWLGAMGEVMVRWLYTGKPKSLESALPQIRSMVLGSLHSKARFKA